MRRVFLPEPLSEQMRIIGPDAVHLGRVLRRRPGDRLEVAGSDGQTAEAEIVSVGPDGIRLALIRRIELRNDPAGEVFLAQGLVKGDKMDWIVQKSVELGVAGIIPYAGVHSVARYEGGKAEARALRWRKIATEAAKQSGRDRVPAVLPTENLAAVFDVFGTGDSIMLFEGETPLRFSQALREASSPRCLLIAGPEGGLSPDEVAAAAARGARVASLGRLILRAETAAVAALAILMHSRGEMGG